MTPSQDKGFKNKYGKKTYYNFKIWQLYFTTFFSMGIAEF